MPEQSTVQVNIVDAPESWGAVVASLTAALQNPDNILIELMELELTPDPVRVHSSIGEIEYDGKTWLGVGSFGQISELESNVDSAAAEIVATMSLVNDVATKAALLLGGQSGRPVTRHWGLIDYNSGALIAAAPVWYGLFDSAKITVSDTLGQVVEVTMTDEMARHNRTQAGTYSDAWQRARYADDRIFEHVESLDSVPVQWGRRD